MHKVNIDFVRHRVVVEFESKTLDHAAWDRVLFAACKQAKGSGDYFDMLCDFTKMQVMATQSADDSAKTVQWLVNNGLRKAANIVGSALMTLQLKRLTGTDIIRSFETISAGQAWLDEQEPA